MISTKTSKKLKKNQQKKYPLEKLPLELQKKYPESVQFNEKGFPDFSPYKINEVEIRYSGRRNIDIRRANKAAGIKKEPDGYIWHHVEDCKTMQLVPR